MNDQTHPSTPEASSERRKRQRRPAQVFDSSGAPVIIRYPCSKCGRMKPLAAFGLRRMGNGQLRNNPQCGPCRGSAKPAEAPSPTNPPAEPTNSPPTKP